MIKNLVFDIGNVLVEYNLKNFLFAKGFDELTVKRIIKASIFTPYWEMFERGELNEDQAFKAFATVDPEIEEQIYKAYNNITGMLLLRDFSVDFIKRLKNLGYNLYCLSNYSEKAYRECADSIEFMKYMDGGLLSFQAHLSKPNPEMYKMFLEKYNLNPAECLFIDDTEKNVLVARELGFEGIVFSTLEATIEEFKKYGIEY